MSGKKEETEEDILNQLMWLRRTKWVQKYPWQARQVGVSGYPLEPVLTGVSRRGGSVMSGEDQRHSYHDDEINALVDSREVLEDGRIIETPPVTEAGLTGGQPTGNPPNVIRGNNADL